MPLTDNNDSEVHSIVPSVCGALRTDFRKNAAWIQSRSGRYAPQPHDLVIAIVHHSSTEHYYCQLTPFSPLALLPHLSFEGVNRKTRPYLEPGDLLYARVGLALPYADVELECVSKGTGKADGLGELKAGYIVGVDKDLARRLGLSEKKQKEDGVVLLEEIVKRGIVFEIAVGANGKVWIDAGGRVGDTMEICRGIVEMDMKNLEEHAQRKLVKSMQFGQD